jgi:hypothetical protein
MEKVAIFGVPRSGTSWLAHIFNSHPDVVLRFQPLFSYGHKAGLNEHASKAAIDRFYGEILHSNDPFALMQAQSQENYPRFHKSGANTHLVFKETRYLNIVRNFVSVADDVKVIGIVRDPLSVLASWMLAPKEFNAEWDIHEEWRQAQRKNRGKPEEFFGFDKWKQFAQTCLDLERTFPQRFMLIRYERLDTDTVDLVSSMFDFCGLRVTGEVLQFIRDSKSHHDPDPYSVFRTRTPGDRWRSILPADITTELVAELQSTPCAQFLPLTAD